MIKSGVPMFTVESVSDAVKYYTEKLGFDIVEMLSEKGALLYGHVKKGKFHLMFCVPAADEVVEFSQMKHFANKSAGAWGEFKTGIEKYYSRCKSKNVKIVQELQDMPWGYKTFGIKDPFGFKVMFGQPITGFKPQANSFYGLPVDISKGEAELDNMVRHLKIFGITRRPAKKHAKAWLKSFKK